VGVQVKLWYHCRKTSSRSRQVRPDPASTERPPTLASSPQAGPVQAVLTSLQGRTQSCSTVSRRLLPSGVLRRRQTETPLRGTRRSRHRQELHEVRCSVIRCRRSVGVEPAATSHPRPPVDRLHQSRTEDLPVWLLVAEYSLLPRQCDSCQPYGCRAPL